MSVRSRSSARHVRIQRSMIAFIRGTWIAVLMIAIPLSDTTASKAVGFQKSACVADLGDRCGRLAGHDREPCPCVCST
jgi:ribonuclease PH